MTLRLVDASRWQVERANPLDLAAAQATGYSLVNIALTGGRGYVSGSWTKVYADRSRELGMGVMTYHWLDGRAPGAQQAANTLARLDALGGRRHIAHQVDVEETGEHGVTPPTWGHVVEYVDAMQQALGRHIVIYSGDWWWQPKGWPGADLTPYLMAQPNAGKRPEYPGDTSADWAAGYGGWSDLAIMQWGVRPLPGTGDCSLSAVRDHGVWADLTGGDVIMPQADPGNSQPSAWLGGPVGGDVLDDLARLVDDLPVELGDPAWLPTSPAGLFPRGAAETCAPVLAAETDVWKSYGGTSLGCVGDVNHGTGFHRGAAFVPATDYSRRRDPNGSDGPYVDWNVACATDFAHNGNAALRAMQRTLLARLMADDPTLRMVCEFIGQPWADRPVMYWARWEGTGNLREYTGVGHDRWCHCSVYRSLANQRPNLWRVPDMALDDAARAWLKSPEYLAAVAGAVTKHLMTTHQVRATGSRNPDTILSDLLAGEQSPGSLIVPTSQTYRQRQLARIEAAAVADEVRDRATTVALGELRAVIGELVTLVKAGGGDPDLAGVFARLDALPELVENAADQAARGVLDRVRAAEVAQAAAYADATPDTDDPTP